LDGVKINVLENSTLLIALLKNPTVSMTSVNKHPPLHRVKKARILHGMVFACYLKNNERSLCIMDAKIKRKGKGGFTLLELLIVVAILGILVAIALPRFAASLCKARSRTDDANIRLIDTQIELYQVNTAWWPEFPNMESLLLSNTYFPDQAPRDPFSNQLTLGAYTLDMRGNPARMRVYTELHKTNSGTHACYCTPTECP